MQSPSLQSHGQVFTALINSLSLPLPVTRGTTAQTESTTGHLSGPGSPNRRHLLLTLHVIFPSLLLPALDLLDRGLVTRFSVPFGSQATLGATTKIATVSAEGDIVPISGSSENIEGRTTDNASLCSLPTGPAMLETPSDKPIRIYIIQSVASTLSRRGRDASQVSKRYVVHLDAWSCSCASFALDAYPSHAETNPAEKNEGSVLPWSFGGLSLDGNPGVGENIPCCKHLLACLLAERWGTVLGGYVEDHRTTKEELAATIASL